MLDSKEKILNYFQNALDNGIQETLLVPNSQGKGKRLIHSVPRLLLCLQGLHQIEYFSSEGHMKTTKGPGAAQYCGKNGYMYHKNLTPSKAISLSYYGEFIRCMHIDYNGNDLPPTSRDTFYHTNSPLSKTGQHLLKILDNLSETGRYQAAAPNLLTALLNISIDDIRTSTASKIRIYSSSHQRWRELDNYIRLHFKEDLSRDRIAEAFNISTSHVSHLYKKFGGKDLTSSLTDYRLEYAAELLKQTGLSVDEIAHHCNFKYTSYFIRRFKKKYKTTPNGFRRNNKEIGNY